MTTALLEDGARPSRLRKRWFFGVHGLVLLGLLALLATRIFDAWSFDDPPPRKIAAMERLSVTLPNGTHALLGDKIRPGIPTVISLWATWCEPCLREAPDIAELRHRFPPEKLNLVYMNVRDRDSSSDDLARHMSRFALPADGYVVADDEVRLGDLTSDHRNMIPHTMVYDQEGKPLGSIVGYKPLALGRIAGLVAN